MSDVGTELTEMERRLAALEAADEGRSQGRWMRRRPVPSEVHRHLRAVRKEWLLAARALLDDWIERLGG